MSNKIKSGDGHAGISRRGLLKGAMASAGALAIAGAVSAHGTVPVTDVTEDIVDLSRKYDFYGSGPQCGIETPPQRYAIFMTFDLTTDDARALQVLLARWSSAIYQLMHGNPAGQVEPTRPEATGGDTGEALDLEPASLTVTVGLGPGVFSNKLGLSRYKPALLRDLISLPGDNLSPELTGGDLSLQACADDPQVVYHAIRNLSRIARITGAAQTRWAVTGFGRASAGKGQSTPRNLFGFKDGTRNVSGKSEFDRYVWINDKDPSWQQHGCYQIVRKIKMRIETWDTDRVSDQNEIFGRHKVSGAPLTGKHEFDTPDFHKRDDEGNLIIPVTSHISLAAHENNDGIKILRRPYNYTDGLNNYAMLDAGLLFISYQKDPAQFEHLQTRLGASDALNEYISHIGSGIFFIPPAPQEGSYIGEGMFKASS
ncbi:iron uptake transporter deferrochelatase/peroxidase subunit [Salmonella enterica]|nr:iron uptake transporter deferrochelatase/peroxidase subunit [Salmonella enterica]MDJ7049089.1 iron uptake transporter deferrochelatase/peroxidase subunit [Salmonella enterica]MDJ7338250.1 iron uptake transporter deferrochelatase/peroxidase subunit [Salmonella enterica]